MTIPKLRATAPNTTPRSLMMMALATSVLLLLTRWYAAHAFGYGDAEALYAVYARHPQAVYRDHPGLIGFVARWIGGGDVPSPRAAHMATAVLATLAPWLVAFIARMLAASWRGALLAALVVAVTPVTAVGLYALTPDLPLFFAWYVAIGCGACALRSRPGSLRALTCALGAGFAAGLACDAKVSGALLLVGFVVAFASRFGRPHLRTLAPYTTLAMALLVASPVISEEIVRGYPMLRHRLLDPHAAWGPSLRNLGAVLGGQLLYLSPLMCVLALSTFRHMHATRHNDATSMLLWAVTVACLPLVLLCLVSRVAEPHWLAPLYLALPLHFARHADAVVERVGKRLCATASLVAAGFTVVAHLWVLLPIASWIAPTAAHYDLSNDLVTWRTALPVVRQALQESASDDAPPVLVGPHWTVCAQLAAGLPRNVLVGCDSPAGDDWDDWLPRRAWQRAPVVLYVTDSRMPPLTQTHHDTAEGGRAGNGASDAPSRHDGQPDAFLATHRQDAGWSARILRGGVEVRTVTIRRFVMGGVATRIPGPFGLPGPAALPPEKAGDSG